MSFSQLGHERAQIEINEFPSVFSEITGLDAALRLAQGKMNSHQKTNSGVN